LRPEEIAEVERIAGELLADSDDSDDDVVAPPPMPVPSDGDSARDKYNRMLYVAKEISRKASVNDVQYDPVLGQLTEILTGLTVSEDGEVRDARPSKGPTAKKGSFSSGSRSVETLSSVRFGWPFVTGLPPLQPIQ
jgi:hypothetical protein